MKYSTYLSWQNDQKVQNDEIKIKNAPYHENDDPNTNEILNSNSRFIGKTLQNLNVEGEYWKEIRDPFHVNESKERVQEVTDHDQPKTISLKD